MKALAASEQVSLPEGPSLVQKEAFASAPSTTIKADRVHRDLSRHQRVTTRGNSGDLLSALEYGL